MTENMQIAVQAIKQFVYFTYNYPSPKHVCEGVWGDQKPLCEHLYKKLMGYINEGSRYESAFNRFYVELSSTHQNELAEWIVRNYDGAGSNKAADDGGNSIDSATRVMIDRAYMEYNEFRLIFSGVKFSNVGAIVEEMNLSYGSEQPSMGNGMADINYKSILATVIREKDGSARVSTDVEVYSDGNVLRYVCENFDKYLDNQSKIKLV